jgi:hypothetical protein
MQGILQVITDTDLAGYPASQNTGYPARFLFTQLTFKRLVSYKELIHNMPTYNIGQKTT